MTDDIDTAGPASADESLIEELLAPVLDLDGTTQAKALESVCARHPAHGAALRARYEVLRWLGLASEDGAVALRAAPAAPPLTGRFGPFRIDRVLGRGGMGIVYLAEDTELGRRVALKVIRPEFLGSERARARFRREVAAAATLDHPGICTVYRAGEVDGQPWLSMRYLEGDSLEAELRDARAGDRGAWAVETSRGGSTGGRLRGVDLRPAIELVESLARAVHVAHEAGLVHRDIKPGNVFVVGGRPVLMDFGLARDAESSGLGLTLTTDPVGTPAYMAPEQIRGRGVDRRTDVHALGAVLYECLTLRSPFPGREREELYRRILGEPPVDLRQLQPAASRDLATVVHKALAKEPVRRYQTALELAEDLLRMLAGEPTHARPPGPIARSVAWTRRHRLLSAVAAALSVGLVVSLGLLQRSLAAEARFRALALVTKAREVQSEDPALAFFVLRDAFGLSPEPEVVAALHELFPELQQQELVREAPGGVESVTRSPRGRWFVTSGEHLNAELYRADGSYWASLPFPVARQGPALAFSPDEDRLVAFLLDGHGGQVTVFDLTAAKPRQVLTLPHRDGPRPIVTALAWHEDRILLIQQLEGSGDSWASLRDAATGEVVVERIGIPSQHGPHSGCAFFSDGRIVVPGGIWSADGATRLAELPVTAAVVDLATYRDPGGSDRVAVQAWQGVTVHDSAGAALGGVHRQTTDMRHCFTRMAVSPTGGAIAAGCPDGMLWLLDGSGKPVQIVNTDGTLQSLTFTPDGSKILIGSYKGRMSRRDLDGRIIDRCQANRHGVCCAPIDPAGTRILTASLLGEVKIWRPEPVPGVPCRLGLTYASLLKMGEHLAVFTTIGRVDLLDSGRHTVARVEVPASGPVSALRHREPDSVWLSDWQSRQLWHWRPLARTLDPPLDPGVCVLALAHLADDSLVLADSVSPSPRRFDLSDPSAGTTADSGWPATFVAASVGGRVAVIVDGRSRLRVVDRGGEEVARDPDPQAAPSMATSLFLTEDGRWAAVGREDGSITLWDVAAGSVRMQWRDLQHRIMSVAITPDGKHVAGAAREHLVIYSVESAEAREPLLYWRPTGEQINQIAFVDDHTLVSAEFWGGRLRWWHWEAEPLRKVLASIDLEPTPEQAAALQRILVLSGESR